MSTTMTKHPTTTTDLGKQKAELADLERDRQECLANLEKTQASAMAALVAHDMEAVQAAWGRGLSISGAWRALQPSGSNARRGANAAAEQFGNHKRERSKR